MKDTIFLNSADLLANQDVPVTIKDRLLIEPGKWNGIIYTNREITSAFKNTDWNDKEKSALILDHEDGMNAAVKNWIGYIRNPRLEEGAKLYGDLEVWNPLIALYLTRAKAKFGISAKLRGEQNGRKLNYFTFENFSVVTRPAVRTAYINLSDSSHLNKLKGGLNMTSEEFKKLQNDEESADEVSEEDLEELKKQKAQDEDVKPKEEQKVDPKVDPKVEKAEEKKEDPKPVKEEKDKKPKDEETMSDIEMLEFTTNSDWTDFVKQMKAKNPNISFQDIAKAYKGKKSSDKEMEKLSEDELLSKFNLISDLLKKNGKYPYPYDEKKQAEDKSKIEEDKKKAEEDAKKKADENSKLSEQIKELQAKLDTPDSRTVTLSQESVNDHDPLEGMATWLIQNAGKGGRIY